MSKAIYVSFMNSLKRITRIFGKFVEGGKVQTELLFSSQNKITIIIINLDGRIPRKTFTHYESVQLVDKDC